MESTRTACCCRECGAGCSAGKLAPIHGFAPRDRASLRARLGDFTRRFPWIAAAEHQAREVFFGLQRGDPALDVVAEHIGATSRSVYASWLYFDLRFEDDRRLAEHFLDHYGSRLGAGERAYVRAGLASCVQVFEIERVGGRAALRDVLGGGVTAAMGVPGAALPGDLVAARIVPCGRSGQPAIDGAALVIHHVLRDVLLGVLRHARADFGATGQSDLRFCEALPPLLHHVWLQPALSPALPAIMAGERGRSPATPDPTSAPVRA